MFVMICGPTLIYYLEIIKLIISMVIRKIFKDLKSRISCLTYGCCSFTYNINNRATYERLL